MLNPARVSNLVEKPWLSFLGGGWRHCWSVGLYVLRHSMTTVAVEHGDLRTRGLRTSYILRLIFYGMAIDRSILDRENDAILDRIFAVEYLFGQDGG